MIIVIGHAIAREGAEAEMARISVEHVLRSRAEPGCLSHEVSRDVERPRRFVFVERWSDLAALQAHFRVPASGAFVKAMAALAEARPVIEIHRAEKVDPG